MENRSAQQMLDKYGFIVHEAEMRLEIGQVAENNWPPCKVVPLGTKLMIVGTIGREEAKAILREFNWDTSTVDENYLYRAVAE